MTTNDSLSRNSSRCGIVGKPNMQTKTGAAHNSSDCGQVCQIVDLSTCPVCVGKVRDFVHTTREQSACNELRSLLWRRTDTKQDGSSFVSVCPCADTPQLNRNSITLFNCVRFVRFYILSLYLSEFFYKFQLRKICKILF